MCDIKLHCDGLEPAALSISKSSRIRKCVLTMSISSIHYFKVIQMLCGVCCVLHCTQAVSVSNYRRQLSENSVCIHAENAVFPQSRCAGSGVQSTEGG